MLFQSKRRPSLLSEKGAHSEQENSIEEEEEEVDKNKSTEKNLDKVKFCVKCVESTLAFFTLIVITNNTTT